MKLYFKCTLLSDIVLTSRSASEGFHASLTYIPGGKFLGIVASSLYADSDKQQALDLFHNGNVRFGNAQIAINNRPSYAVPFSWYVDKLKVDENVYLHHKLNKQIKEEQAMSGLQLKQERSGYINSDATWIAKIDQDFSIKSAYDYKRRKSLDKNMYGYHALKSGSDFLFTVEISDKKYQKLITDALLGKKRIGRSRTAEYGLVEIKSCEPFDELQHQTGTDNLVLGYAISDWCFYDEFGFPTTNISAKDLGIEGGKINWEKSQIRYRKYQSYNSHRLQTNEDRMVFQKGSVVAIDLEDSVDYTQISNWVGSLNSEGFGKMVCNPPFLSSQSEYTSLPKEHKFVEKTKSLAYANGELDNQILSMIDRRSSFIKEDNHIEELVNSFFLANQENLAKKSSKSQWGAIRSIAKSTIDRAELMDLLFHKDGRDESNSKGFLRRGVAAKQWAGKVDSIAEFARKDNNSQALLIKLASKMQKYLD
jgi:hypothetical protein